MPSTISEPLRSGRPPGPRTWRPFGHLGAFRRDVIGFLRKVAVEFGDVAYFKVGGVGIALLNHPDLIRDVLVTRHGEFTKGRPLEAAKQVLGDGLLTSEGKVHDRHRRLVAPAFRRDRLESYATAMTERAAALSERWSGGEIVDMADHMLALATEIAGETLLDTSLSEREVYEIGEALETVLQMFPRVSIPFAVHLLKLPLPSSRSFHQAVQRLDEVVRRIVRDGRQRAIDTGSLISVLLATQAVEDERDRLSDVEVRDEVLTLLLTALDTTSLALTWTWYLLSQEPAIEARLHEEVDRVLGGRAVTAADVPQLTYARMVLTEAIRLYPPLYVIAREPRKDFAIGDYVIPAGTQVLMSPYLMHHDPRYYEDPESFDPSRWKPERRATRPKFAYFPFGGGPRVCIGEGFAWMEGVIVLSTLAGRWRPLPAAGHRVETEPLINLRPRGGMPMVLERRRPSTVP